MLQHPYAMFGIECQDGWKQLYQPIIDWIVEYNKTHEGQIEITQIKEKFGGLRFYVDNAPQELHDMISKAEDESYHVCEDCGSRENVGLLSTGWYRTVCMNCAQKIADAKGQKQLFRKTIEIWPKNQQETESAS